MQCVGVCVRAHACACACACTFARGTQSLTYMYTAYIRHVEVRPS